MSKIAIDVVLLPSEEMTEKVIQINKELLKNNSDKIRLNNKNCLPHISLCMGCIEEEDISEAKKIIDEISSNFSLFDLEAFDLQPNTIPTGDKVSGLHIKKTKRIQDLHTAIMKGLWKYLSYDANTSMLFNSPEVEEVTLYWIKNYSKKYNNPSIFYPHITVGFGETNDFELPIKFQASKIAICQLGNYCTCRKVFYSVNLKNK